MSYSYSREPLTLRERRRERLIADDPFYTAASIVLLNLAASPLAVVGTVTLVERGAVLIPMLMFSVNASIAAFSARFYVWTRSYRVTGSDYHSPSQKENIREVATNLRAIGETEIEIARELGDAFWATVKNDQRNERLRLAGEINRFAKAVQAREDARRRLLGVPPHPIDRLNQILGETREIESLLKETNE